MILRIESGIPAPVVKRRLKKTRSDRGSRMRLPLMEMDVGDSLYVPGDFLSRKNIQVICSKFSTDLNRKYMTRQENSGTRIWRLA